MMDMLSHTRTLSQVVTSTSLSTALCLQQIYKNYTETLSSVDISYEFDFLQILSRDELACCYEIWSVGLTTCRHWWSVDETGLDQDTATNQSDLSPTNANLVVAWQHWRNGTQTAQQRPVRQ